MSKRASRRAKRKLEERRKDYDSIKKGQEARKRPGTLNPRKT